MTITTTMSAYHNRFTFSGKEKDSETGYYYFGARYYNSDLSLWLSVDPMADKYPSLSPYNYCAWNPMKLVDPNGEDIWQVDGYGQLIWKEASDVDRIIASNCSDVDVAEGILKRGASYTVDDGHFFLNFGDNSDNATEVFEFLADNASVEFSLIGIAKDPLNDNPDRFYLSTSFQLDGDSFGSDYACRASSKNHMRSHTHNHPGDNAPIIPSSILNNGSILVPFANISRGDDLGLANYIKEGSPSCSFNIYHSSKGGRVSTICHL